MLEDRIVPRLQEHFNLYRLVVVSVLLLLRDTMTTATHKEIHLIGAILKFIGLVHCRQIWC